MLVVWFYSVSLFPRCRHKQRNKTYQLFYSMNEGVSQVVTSRNTGVPRILWSPRSLQPDSPWIESKTEQIAWPLPPTPIWYGPNFCITLLQLPWRRIKIVSKLTYRSKVLKSNQVYSRVELDQRWLHWRRNLFCTTARRHGIVAIILLFQPNCAIVESFFAGHFSWLTDTSHRAHWCQKSSQLLLLM